MSVLYDRIGRSYSATRGADPRIMAAIEDAHGDPPTVHNVGAGAGSYEPRDRRVTALEPSAVMRAQRPPGAAPCIDGRAEALPFPDRSFDATMAILSDHHWSDRLGGLRELRRVGRRAVVFQYDPACAGSFWLARDHLPTFMAVQAAGHEEARRALGATREVVVPIPHDCRDGFLSAYWRRPEAYLDPAVRANISVFSLLPEAEVDAMVADLRADLASGAWARRNAAILDADALDLGYRLLIAG